MVNEVIQYYLNNNSNVYITLLDASKAFDRVEYVSLFSLLMSKGICPLIVRFLVVMYTNQSFRVKWCSGISQVVKANNGVKQGGVLSPLLFTLYIDVLLQRLKLSHYGCHIGNVFCGAFGYADDVILISPTVNGLVRQLDICSIFGSEHNVMFNPSKTKLVSMSNAKSVSSPNVIFMGEPIEVVDHCSHLGVKIGNIGFDNIISDACNEFTAKVNMVRSHFKNIPPNIVYHLFKTFCMPLYGCTLWDYSSKYMSKFYVCWRKAIRYLLDLPRTTHCELLPAICNDISVTDQLYHRFIRFSKSLSESVNEITKLCYNLALGGSNSNLSNSLTAVSAHFSIPRFDVHHVNIHALNYK